MIKRALTSLALAAGVGLTGAVVTAPAAQAGVQDTCSTPAWGCLFYGDNHTGKAIAINGDDVDLGHDGDKADSSWNATGFYLVLYEHDNWRGDCAVMRPKSRTWDLDKYGWGLRISSIRYFQHLPTGCLLLGN